MKDLGQNTRFELFRSFCACLWYVCNVCVCAGTSVPRHACDSQRTISCISPHFPPCLTQIPLSLPVCTHTSWPAGFRGSSCYCPPSVELWNFRLVLLHQLCTFQVLGLAQQVLYLQRLLTKQYWQHLTSLWLMTSAHRVKCCQ